MPKAISNGFLHVTVKVLSSYEYSKLTNRTEYAMNEADSAAKVTKDVMRIMRFLGNLERG